MSLDDLVVIVGGDGKLLQSEYRNEFICGASLGVMRKMPSESVDLVITSPPYNLKNSTGNGMKNGSGGKWYNSNCST